MLIYVLSRRADAAAWRRIVYVDTGDSYAPPLVCTINDCAVDIGPLRFEPSANGQTIVRARRSMEFLEGGADPCHGGYRVSEYPVIIAMR